MRRKRTGSITLGVMLVVFGILFFLRLFIPALTFMVVLRFWPLLFIFLGAEILIQYFMDKEGVFKYDTGAIILLILILSFAICMGGMEWLIENAPSHWYY